jgi:hypothetical protein
MRPWTILLTLGLLVGPADDVSASLPGPAEIERLEATPAAVTLKGGHDARQILLTATLAGGRLQDLTTSAVYRVGDPKVARVSKTGRVIPLGDGRTQIVAEFAGREIKVECRVESFGVAAPVDFPNQVVPIFTKLGCNSGGCHGKLSGQNGFRLSLLGFDPKLDHDTLVKEARGRRLFLPAPEQSLLLQKAIGKIPHGGGRKLRPNSDEYRIIRRWIEAGAPAGKEGAAVVTRLKAVPEQRIMTRGNRQQLAVLAEYSDGRVDDVTPQAQYESNDPEVAAVDDEGLVETKTLSGEAAVMVRYQGLVAVFRITVPFGANTPDYAFPEPTFIDRLTHKKWRALGLAPSDLCTDEQFVRRVSLDITGTLPKAPDVRAFVADTSPDKRARLIDRLLDSSEYADYFAHKWADVLRVNRQNFQSRAYGTFAFHRWIRKAIAADTPYDQFARSILTAVGDESQFPPAVWYKELAEPPKLADDTAQVFLGLRIACAQCHHHPYEKWSQDDYWGLAAFFARVRRREIIKPGLFNPFDNGGGPQAISVGSDGAVYNTRTGQAAPLKPLDGKPIEVPPGDDPRQKLADWMADPANPFFAKAIANRYWAHFFGRGIVDPMDDMRLTNPPSNPELLDALAADFVAHRYSLKHLARTICNSRTYQLSAVPNDSNRQDKHSYARYYPKRMSAEVLFDAVSQVIGTPANFDGLPADAHAPHRAMVLPDEAFSSYFLDVFGRPKRRSACECERVNAANLAQVLHLLNSEDLQNRISRQGARADLLAKDPRPDAEKIEELFLWAFARKPSSGQLAASLAHVEEHAKDKKTAYENILWTLINAKEFSFNE